MDLEEAGEGAAGAAAEVCAEAKNGDGLDLEARLAPRRSVFVPIVGKVSPTDGVCLVFKRNVLIAVRL